MWISFVGYDVDFNEGRNVWEGGREITPFCFESIHGLSLRLFLGEFVSGKSRRLYWGGTKMPKATYFAFLQAVYNDSCTAEE